MSTDWIPISAARSIPAKERGNRGLFPSPKVAEGIVEYESCLERDISVTMLLELRSSGFNGNEIHFYPKLSICKNYINLKRY